MNRVQTTYTSGDAFSAACTQPPYPAPRVSSLVPNDGSPLPKVPASFEPGHVALTAAMAASAAESAAAAAATAPVTAAAGDPQHAAQPAAAVAPAAATNTGGAPAMDSEKLKQGGRATIPSTPADGACGANGGGVGIERRSTERVTSGNAAVNQVLLSTSTNV